MHFKMDKKALKKKIHKALKGVDDPELGYSIVDIGLIYDIEISKDNVVVIVMTLTSMGCPMFGQIEQDVVSAARSIDGVTEVSVELTFDPPWSPELMTEEVRAEMGIEL